MRKFQFFIFLSILFFCEYSIAQSSCDLSVKSLHLINSEKFYIENKDQWDQNAKYLTRTDGLDAWVLKDGAMLLDFYNVGEKKSELNKINKNPEDRYKDAVKKGHRILMKWINSNCELHFEKLEKQEGYYNYLIGNDPSKHAINVGLYSKIIGENLYKGIDLQYYHNKGSVRYDLIVKSNADPNQIKLKIEGSDELKIDGKGNIIIKTCLGNIKMQDLYVYEKETKKQVACKWVKNKNNELTLSIGDYNKNNTLIIDPLIYSTYVGGSGIQESFDIVSDTAGNAFITGATTSPNFDISIGAYQNSLDGAGDIFVSKINSSGTGYIFSTFIGGNADEVGKSLVLDTQDNVYITGYSRSTDFDVTPGAFQSVLTGAYNVIITKLNSTGTLLLYSTYLGGSNYDFGYGIAVDNLGNAYVAGKTSSNDFDVTSGAYQPFYGTATAAFVTKLNPTGTGLVYSTYLHGGGSGGPDIANGIVVDTSGNAFITGTTLNHAGFITPGVHSSGAGGSDVFVTKLNSAGSARLYSTCIGGSGSSFEVESDGAAIAIDSVGNAYVTGRTVAQNFDVTPGAFQTIKNEAFLFDAFVFKLNADATSLIYSTYLGGS